MAHQPPKHPPLRRAPELGRDEQALARHDAVGDRRRDPAPDLPLVGVRGRAVVQF